MQRCSYCIVRDDDNRHQTNRGIRRSDDRVALSKKKAFELRIANVYFDRIRQYLEQTTGRVHTGPTHHGRHEREPSITPNSVAAPVIHII
jgi:hypothetical protein